MPSSAAEDAYTSRALVSSDLAVSSADPCAVQHHDDDSLGTTSQSSSSSSGGSSDEEDGNQVHSPSTISAGPHFVRRGAVGGAQIHAAADAEAGIQAAVDAHIKGMTKTDADAFLQGLADPNSPDAHNHSPADAEAGIQAAVDARIKAMTKADADTFLQALADSAPSDVVDPQADPHAEADAFDKVAAQSVAAADVGGQALGETGAQALDAHAVGAAAHGKSDSHANPAGQALDPDTAEAAADTPTAGINVISGPYTDGPDVSTDACGDDDSNELAQACEAGPNHAEAKDLLDAAAERSTASAPASGNSRLITVWESHLVMLG